jgi:hypothetical protein
LTKLLEGSMRELAVVILIAFWLTTLVMVNRALRYTRWSLADALSESGKASSSRLIAFLFAVIAAGLVMGVSVYTLDRLFAGSAPNLAGVLQLLGASTTMFVPYGMNQFAGALETRASQNPFAAVPGPVPPALAPAMQVTAVQGSLAAGQSSVLTLLGTGFAAGMAAVLIDPVTGLTLGQTGGIVIQSPVQAQVTVSPGPSTRGQTAVLQLSAGAAKAVSSPIQVV